MTDIRDLERFVTAQDRDDMFEAAVQELRAGRKASHWMWFVFPQMRGLGRTSTAEHYGIGSRDEAIAYLAHGVLGPRLRRCARLVVSSGAVTAEALLGSTDALKLRSSMTLFAEVAPDVEGAADFVAVLEKYCDGARDPRTLELLGPT